MNQKRESHPLQQALESRRQEIATSLESARTELESIRQREEYLVRLITDAEAALGAPTHEKLTLHEAMIRVLDGADGEWMSTSELAAEVNRRGLYSKRDGSPVETNQIHARAKNYLHLFEKDGQMIRLRAEGDEPESDRPRTSKYDPLRRFLERQTNPAPTITFDELKDMVGRLPRSAWKHPAWWANQESGSHVQAFAWIDAGFRVDRVNQDEGWVRFHRDDDDDGISGVREPRRPRPKSPGGANTKHFDEEASG